MREGVGEEPVIRDTVAREIELEKRRAKGETHRGNRVAREIEICEAMAREGNWV